MDINQLDILPTLPVLDDALFVEQVRIKFHNTVEHLTAEWDEFMPNECLFLRTPYLKTLESAPPENMRFCYLTFTINEQAIGAAACQIQYFKGDSTFQDKPDGAPCFFEGVSRYFRNLVAKNIGFHTLVCGSLLLTGEHGYYFHPDLNKDLATQLLMKGLDKASAELGKQNIPISLTLMKDFFEATQQDIAERLVAEKFFEFKVQPNMILDISADWTSFEDYLAAMTSKYRVRVKRAFKKGKNIVRKELSFDEISANKQQIFDLYKNVSKNAGFNTFTFTPDYFPELKKHLGDDLKFVGTYLDNALVGFYTTIHSGGELDAHFLGFDYEVNRATQLYLNMLYDMIKIALSYQAHRIIFSRTALEIKSSVGAVPHEMYCYLRHRNSISNRFVKNFVEYLTPQEEWTQRHPFKAETPS